MRYLAQKQELKVSVRMSKLMLLQCSISKSENCLNVAIRAYYLIISRMSKLSENVALRLKAAQQLIKKDKEKSLQSPNFAHIVVTYRKESFIGTLFNSQQAKTTPLTYLMAQNDVKIGEVKQMIRKRLNFQQNESIQLFCKKRLLNDLSKTIKDLRSDLEDGSIEIEVTKMQVF